MKHVLYTPIVISLMYTMVATHPDVAHVIGVVNKFMHNPKRQHWNAIKHVDTYLVSTQNLGILSSPNEDLGIVGYIDSDFAGCVDSRKSTTKY